MMALRYKLTVFDYLNGYVFYRFLGTQQTKILVLLDMLKNLVLKYAKPPKIMLFLIKLVYAMKLLKYSYSCV